MKTALINAANCTFVSCLKGLIERLSDFLQVKANNVPPRFADPGITSSICLIESKTVFLELPISSQVRFQYSRQIHPIE